MGEKSHRYQPLDERGASAGAGSDHDDAATATGDAPPSSPPSPRKSYEYDVEEADRAIAAREHNLASRERRVTRLLQINVILLVASICFFSSRLVMPSPKLDMHECAKLLSPACESSSTSQR